LIGRQTLPVLAALIISIGATAPASAEDVQYLLHGDGGRLDWSETNQMLVLDRPDGSGFARIWIMDKTGSNLRCLSCDNSNLPREHHGNPAWHPGGKYIVFQATDPTVANRAMAKTSLYKLYTSPGAGTNNNIWIMTSDGKRVWQITKLKKSEGVLHPHFSPDGSKLLWAQRLNNEGGIGRWAIKVAEFSDQGGDPVVNNITTLTPGNMLWYETHGFSPDNGSIIFTGMPKDGKGANGADFDIYTYNLKTSELKCLTDRNLKQWDEHAHYTPDGKRIVWMSSMGNPQTAWRLNQFTVKTDFWIMNSDGTNQQQISFFNDPPGKRSKKKRVIASDLSICGDGSCLYGYIQDPGTMVRPGSVVRLLLPLASK
jgi:Tol biopolymer transport system component